MQNNGKKLTAKTAAIATGIIALAAFWISFGYYMLTDDELNPEIPIIIEEYNNSVSLIDNGSVYQLGMWASFEDDPYEVALWRLDQFKNALIKANGLLHRTTYEDYPEEKWLTIEEHDYISPLICDMENLECLEYIWENSEQIPELLTQYNAYKDRYEQLTTYKHFAPFPHTSIFTPQIQYGPDFFASRLVLLSIIHLVKTGRVNEAANELARLFEFNRKLLNDTPYSETKLFGLNTYISKLRLLSYLLSKSNYENVHLWIPVLNALPPVEDKKGPVRKMIQHNFMRSVNDSITVFDRIKKELSSPFEKLKFKLFFKKNKTLNLLYEYSTTSFEQIMEMKGKFIIKESQIRSTNSLDYIQINNISGSIAATSAFSALYDLERELYSLDYMQSLIKQIYLVKIRPHSSPKELLDSLFPLTNQPPYFNEQKLCFKKSNTRGGGTCLYYF